MVSRGLDLITIVVPPALPIVLTVGMVCAVDRLKNHRISCISPSRFVDTPSVINRKWFGLTEGVRVNVAGKVDCFCFDKTGTLTMDGLDVLGVREAINGRFVQSFNINSLSLLFFVQLTDDTLTEITEK